jgi:hypothetical protein
MIPRVKCHQVFSETLLEVEIFCQLKMEMRFCAIQVYLSHPFRVSETETSLLEQKSLHWIELNWIELNWIGEMKSLPHFPLNFSTVSLLHCLAQLIFKLMQATYIIFMYYYKFFNVVYNKIVFKNSIFTSLNL